MAQLIQNPLEGRALRLQLSEKRLTAEPQLAGDDGHAGVAGMQDGHQQALDATLSGFRTLQAFEQRIGMFAQDAKDVTRLERDPVGHPRLIDQERILVALENDGHAKDPLILGAIPRVRVGDVHRLYQLCHAELARPANHAGEGGFGEFGKTAGVLAGVDQPEPRVVSKGLKAIGVNP